MYSLYAQILWYLLQYLKLHSWEMFQKQLLVILVICGRLTDACKRYFQTSMTEFATIAFATPAQLRGEFTTMSQKC